jgi:perosamine synthetase
MLPPSGDIGPGDHVLVPSFTMVAVANAVKMVGATPIYVDCADGQLNPAVGEYMAKATPKCKCVVTCHTFGVPAEIDAIAKMCKEQKWLLVEDICEAIGTKSGGKLVGTFGDFACGSLYANKVVTAGDGGWVHCRDPKRHDRVKSIINHGFDPLYHFLHFETAPNAKMNGLGAALAVPSFDELEDLNAHRHQMATWYRKHLEGTPLMLMPEGQRDEPWVFGAVTKEAKTKEEVRVHLASHGIETRNYFFPMHLEPVNFFQGTQTYEIPLPESERIATCGFYFPSHRYLEEKDVEYICAVTKKFFDKAVSLPKCTRKPNWVDRTEDPSPALPDGKRRKLNGVNGQNGH